jgi:hypothetical protein
MFDPDAPTPHLAPVGETRFVQGSAPRLAVRLALLGGV